MSVVSGYMAEDSGDSDFGLSGLEVSVNVCAYYSFEASGRMCVSVGEGCVVSVWGSLTPSGGDYLSLSGLIVVVVVYVV